MGANSSGNPGGEFNTAAIEAPMVLVISDAILPFLKTTGDVSTKISWPENRVSNTILEL